MKIKINKALLASLPSSVASIVSEFRATTRKSSISVDRRSSFWIQEDAKYTAFGPDGRSITVRASGEFAGVTDLAPGRECPLPLDCLVVETGRFWSNQSLRPPFKIRQSWCPKSLNAQNA